MDMANRPRTESERQRTRRAVRIAGQHVTALIRRVERDPDLGPKVAAALDRHARDVMRLKLLKSAPAAWDLLQADRWPSRRKPRA